MKALVYEKYGSPDVLFFSERQKPKIGDFEVLLKVHTASLNSADLHLLKADPFLARFFSGLFRPKYKILGTDVAGIIEAVGSKVSKFASGEEVFGSLFENGFGAFAEYAHPTENSLVQKPASLSFEEAASLPTAGVTALQGLRDAGKIQAGQKVLINGASGGVGSFAVQLAKFFGAEVSAVCSAKNLEQSSRLGADHVIDYNKEDFTKSGKTYDLILAVNGFHPLSDYLNCLNAGGRYVMVGGTNAQMFQSLLRGQALAKKTKKHVAVLTLEPEKKQPDLLFLTQLCEQGKLKVLLDKVYAFDNTIEAFRYLEQGHAGGKIVIKMI